MVYSCYVLRCVVLKKYLEGTLKVQSILGKYWPFFLIHGIVDVLNKFVPQLNVLSADCGDWFFIAVWLLVRLVVVIIVVSKPGKKCSHYGPARQHLGIHNLALPCCTEAPNVTAGDCLRR